MIQTHPAEAGLSRPLHRLANWLTADSLNVLNRMPQGSVYNDSMMYPREVDPSHPFRFKFFIPSNVLKLNYAKLSIGLEAFRSPVAGANTVTSGASSAASAGSSSASSSGAGDTSHSHSTEYTSIVGAPAHALGLDAFLSYVATGSAGSISTNNNSANHDHTIPHNHPIPHTHDSTPTLTYGIFEGATAAGVSVSVNGTDRTSALGGPFSADQAELTLLIPWLNIGAWNTILLTPTGLGTIIGHLRLTGYVQSV